VRQKTEKNNNNKNRKKNEKQNGVSILPSQLRFGSKNQRRHYIAVQLSLRL
jgi:hypothetical protein